MGRKLKFTREELLTKAVAQFWRYGYGQTSLKHLLKAMEIGEGSFYNTFGSKSELYKECINYYNSTEMKNRIMVMMSDRTPKEKLFEFYRVIIDEMKPDCGCMMSNSLNKDVIYDEDLQPFIFGQIDGFLSTLEGIIEQGKELGEFKSNLNAQQAALNYFAHLHGVFRFSAFMFDKKLYQESGEQFLTCLLLPTKDVELQKQS
ncbi:TetR/AcrR family transcriptional regulator [Vibrio sp.]|nr:TetR/AcrR family transcriptional regulator [Vibrio sp.]